MKTSQGDGAPSDPDELRGQIEETRAELGEAVEALAAKADVKAQVKDKVAGRKEQLKEKQEQATAKVAQVREKVSGATPEQARDALSFLRHRAQERPVPAAFLAGSLVGWLLGMRRKRRKRR